VLFGVARIGLERLVQIFGGGGPVVVVVDDSLELLDGVVV